MVHLKKRLGLFGLVFMAQVYVFSPKLDWYSKARFGYFLFWYGFENAIENARDFSV